MTPPCLSETALSIYFKSLLVDFDFGKWIFLVLRIFSFYRFKEEWSQPVQSSLIVSVLFPYYSCRR